MRPGGLRGLTGRTMNQTLKFTVEAVARAVRGTSGVQGKAASARAPRSRRVQVRSAFTLIELLTVLAVIGVLAGLLLPALGAAKSRAQTARCTAHLRQFALALPLYAADHADRLPPNADGREEALGAKWVEGWLGLPGPGGHRKAISSSSTGRKSPKRRQGQKIFKNLGKAG